MSAVRSTRLRDMEGALRNAMRIVWPGCDFEVNANGNCASAVASLLELSQGELEHHDQRFPVRITIRGTKPA